MNFYNLAFPSEQISLKNVLYQSVGKNNGLFFPCNIPTLPQAILNNLGDLSLKEIALEVTQLFVGSEIPNQQLSTIINNAINFETPLKKLDTHLHALELYHGPTLAFKDIGAQFLSQLFTYFHQQSPRKTTLLVATSGDTGGAVASAFSKCPNLNVIILYPNEKVSKLQELQLNHLGQNVRALAVNGTFDDCQTLVKQAFLDKEITRKIQLCSANSINLFRLIPQTFYYLYASGQLGKAHPNGITFSVPSGNLGNLTAGILAKRIGQTNDLYVAAFNKNNLLERRYKDQQAAPKPTIATLSNAMDVGHPSNLPRLLTLYNNHTAHLMKEVAAYSFSDTETIYGMQEVYQRYHFQIDPHSSIGYLGLKKHQEKNLRTGVFLCTAHPAKFPETIKRALGFEPEIPFALTSLLEKQRPKQIITNKLEELKAILVS